MKVIIWICRILVGVLFIVSGLIKANDPLGFSYKLDEYFEVFADEFRPKQDTVFVELFQEQDTIFKLSKKLTVVDSILPLQFNIIRVMPDTAAGEALDTVYQDYTISGLVGQETKESSYYGPYKATFRYRLYLGEDLIKEDSFNAIPGEEALYTDQVNVYDRVNQPGSLVSFFQSLKKFSLYFSMGMSVLEILLGMALLMGVYAGITSWLLLLLIIFFTFLTGYSAIAEKVTDCGCFGDALKLTPRQSFYKDLVLFVLIVLIFIKQKIIYPNSLKVDAILMPVSLILMALFTLGLISWSLPLFFTAFLFLIFGLIKWLTRLNSAPFIILITLMVSIAYTTLAYHHLPFQDFRPYKEGNDICELKKLPPDAKEQIARIVFIYKDKTTGEEIEVSADNFSGSEIAKNKENYEFVERNMHVIQEADVAAIEDFPMLTTAGADIQDSLLNKPGFKFFVIAYDLEKTKTKRWEALNELQRNAEEQGIPFYGLTSSGGMIEEFRHTHQAAFPFYSSDPIVLKTVIRANPGIMLMKDCEILEKWHWRDLPDFEDLNEEYNLQK